MEMINLDDSAGSFRIRDYLGWAKHVREMKVPSAPALYVWTRELPESSQLSAEINKWIGPSLRTDAGRVGPYSSVALQTASPGLGPAKVELLREMAALPTFAWTRNLAARWQRPLYVGITVNLRQRLSTHMAYDSSLRQYMSDANYEMARCRVTYFHPPYDATDLSWDDDEEEGVDLEQDTPIPEVLIRSLRLTEALIIRLAQPYLNQSME